MAEFQKAQQPKSYLYELKTHGQKAFLTLCQLSPKLSHLHRDPNDIKPQVQAYRTIASNLSLELKKYDIKAIAKSFWKLFEDMSEIINGFLIGKILPPVETLMNTDHWDVDTYLNKKLSKICESTLQNMDQVGNTTNKAQGELVQVMASLNRQLSSIGAVNYEDIHYMNFQEMILGQLQQIYKKGKRNEMLVEKGKTKLHTIIKKIIQAEQMLRRKFGRVASNNTQDQQSQTIEIVPPPPPPDVKTPRTRIAMKLDEKQTVNFNEQKEMLLLKIEHFHIIVMQKDIDISKLKAQIQSNKKQNKITQQKIKKQFDKKLKDMQKQPVKLTVQRKVVDIKLQMIVSQKMIPINNKTIIKKNQNKQSRNIISMSEGRYSGRKVQSFKNVSRQSSIEFSSKEVQVIQSPLTRLSQPRKSSAIPHRILQIQEPMPTQKFIQNNHPKEFDMLKTFGIMNNNTLAQARKSFNETKIKKKQLQKYVKIKKWRTAPVQQDQKQEVVRPKKILFQIQSQNKLQDTIIVGGRAKSPLNLNKKQNKQNNSFFTVVTKSKSKSKSKPVTANEGSQNGNQPDTINQPLFIENDYELFGGKQGAQKFEAVKIKPDRNNFCKHSSKNSQLSNSAEQGSNQKNTEKAIVQLFESLRGIKRKNLTKYQRIINYLRFPYSYMKSPDLQAWQKKQQDNDIGFKQMKGIIMKLLQIHKDCQLGTSKIFCNHFSSLFSKINFISK